MGHEDLGGDGSECGNPHPARRSSPTYPRSQRPEEQQLARQAAERYAEIGDLAPAAHAFWLAGQLLRDNDQVEDAVWSFESAAEGFALAHDRVRRSEVVGELVTLLRATGQELRAEEAVASMAPRPFTN